MTENDEKLWEEIESCLKYGNNCYNGEYPFLETTSIENLMDLFENKQTDLLKKFVEWYKGHLEHIQKHEKKFLDGAVDFENPQLVVYRKGTTDMLDRLLSHIDGKLEEFLEENKI